MSAAAQSWAGDPARSGRLRSRERVLLVVLADYADDVGAGVYPTVGTLMARTGWSESTVHRGLARLRAAGLIVPGDPGLVAHYRGDRRPPVWDLGMAHGVSRGVTSDTRHGVSRGVSSASDGVSVLTPKPRTEPNYGTGVGLKPSPTARGVTSDTRSARGVTSDTPPTADPVQRPLYPAAAATPRPSRAAPAQVPTCGHCHELHWSTAECSSSALTAAVLAARAG